METSFHESKKLQKTNKKEDFDYVWDIEESGELFLQQMREQQSSASSKNKQGDTNMNIHIVSNNSKTLNNNHNDSQFEEVWD